MELSKDELIHSALKEIINIGGGNAATSLSQLIKHPVEMDVPTLELMDDEEVYQSILADDEDVKVVIMQLLNGEGSFLFVISPKEVEELARMMLDENVELTDELMDSALKELVNILVNSFLNASMKMLDMSMIATVPMLFHDLFGSILSTIYLEHGQYDSTIVIMQNEFWSKGNKIEGSLFFIPTPEFMDQLLEKIKQL